MEAANARNLGMPPADQPMQLSLPPAELTSSQLRELGKSQSSRAGAWEALKFVGLGFIATRHFTNKAVMHIRSENMRHITATFGLSETSAKALAKTSTAKRTILTDTHKTYIKSDADKLQVLEAVRKPNHWARGIFSAGDQKTFDSLTPEKALKPDEMVVATHLITQWDELNRLSKEVSPEVFKQLLAAAGAFESNVQPELTAKLNDLVSLYNALPQDTPDRVATAIEVNKIINEASAQQEYAHIGEAGNFRAFVTEKIKTSDDGLQAVQNREQPIERAFNLVSYGKDIVEGVGRELADKICSQVLGANVTTGAVHYKLSPNYENVKSELESIVTMKNQCESCGIGAAFPILLEKALGEIEVEESPDALSALKGKLGAHFKPLRLLVAVKEEYDKAGRTESYNASIAQKVAAFQTDPTASGLESIAQEMRLAYFADQANVAVEKLGQRFGLQLAAVARQEFDRVLVGQQSGEQFVEIHGKLLDAATNLEDARVRFVREEGLTDNDFKQVLDGLLRADPPKVTLEGLSRKDGQQMHHLSAACRLHSTEKSKQEWLQEYGTELRPYLDQVLASKGYEGVADGSLSLKNSTWMEAAQGWTLEETQMWSVATAVQVSNRAVPPLEIRDILLSTDLTVPMNRRLDVIRARNEWTNRLATQDNLPLVIAFTRLMADPYLVDIGPDADSHIRDLFSYAMDLSKNRDFSLSVVASAMRGVLDLRKKQYPLQSDAENLAGIASGVSLGKKVSTIQISDREKQLFNLCAREFAVEKMAEAFKAKGEEFGVQQRVFAELIAMEFQPTDEIMQPHALAYMQSLVEGAVALRVDKGLTANEVTSRLMQAAREDRITLSPLAMNRLEGLALADALKKLVAFLTDVQVNAKPGSEGSYADVISIARTNVSGALTTVIRGLVHGIAPANTSKEQLARLDRRLNDFRLAIEQSPYQTSEGVATLLPEKAVQLATAGTAVLGGMVLNPAPGAEGAIATLVDHLFDAAHDSIPRIREGGPGFVNYVLRGEADSPIVGGVGLLVNGLLQARRDRLNNTPDDKLTPLSAIFVKVLPAIFNNSQLIAFGLSAVTSRPGKFLIRRLAPGIIDSATKDLNLTPQQRKILKTAVPLVLEILDILDLKGEAAQKQLAGIMNLVNVMRAAVEGDEEPDPVQLMETIIQALSYETGKLFEVGDVLVEAIKGVSLLASPSTPAAPASSS